MASRVVMSSARMEDQREGAEIFSGDVEVCKAKTMELLEELHLPRGLLPLEEIEEVGRNRSTGFVWLKQKKSHEHRFAKINRLVWYDTEVTAFVEDRRMKRMTGVKTKELFIWITLSEMFIDDPASHNITFKTPAGLSRSYPASAFDLDLAPSTQ